VSEANAYDGPAVQARLFRLAVEDLTIRAHRTVQGYWELIWRCRRADETWQDASAEHFELLTTEELVDVLEALAGRLLEAR